MTPPPRQPNKNYAEDYFEKHIRLDHHHLAAHSQKHHSLVSTETMRQEPRTEVEKGGWGGRSVDSSNDSSTATNPTNESTHHHQALSTYSNTQSPPHSCSDDTRTSLAAEDQHPTTDHSTTEETDEGWTSWLSLSQPEADVSPDAYDSPGAVTDTVERHVGNQTPPNPKTQTPATAKIIFENPTPKTVGTHNPPTSSSSSPKVPTKATPPKSDISWEEAYERAQAIQARRIAERNAADAAVAAAIATATPISTSDIPSPAASPPPPLHQTHHHNQTPKRPTTNPSFPPAKRQKSPQPASGSPPPLPPLVTINTTYNTNPQKKRESPAYFPTSFASYSYPPPSPMLNAATGGFPSAGWSMPVDEGGGRGGWAYGTESGDWGARVRGREDGRGRGSGRQPMGRGEEQSRVRGGADWRRGGEEGGGWGDRKVSGEWAGNGRDVGGGNGWNGRQGGEGWGGGERHERGGWGNSNAGNSRDGNGNGWAGSHQRDGWGAGKRGEGDTWGLGWGREGDLRLRGKERGMGSGVDAQQFGGGWDAKGGGGEKDVERVYQLKHEISKIVVDQLSACKDAMPKDKFKETAKSLTDCLLQKELRRHPTVPLQLSASAVQHVQNHLREYMQRKGMVVEGKGVGGWLGFSNKSFCECWF
ncbi:hypothetical protein HDV00_012159 [Rhizophlyctis rosea]|nr:hypothetical protein HDV00_012159 [Rhizophlyctis rosea]